MFHWRDGWFFERMPDGSVMITKRKDAGLESPIITREIIPPGEWASIVASVSIKGENDRRWYTALDFHMKETTWTCSRCSQVNPIEIVSGYLNECINCHNPILGTSV